MTYVEEIIQATCIAFLVANFLLNTGRALKAIELCKESLVLLSYKVLSVEKPSWQRLYGKFYLTMFEAYCRVSDHTNATTYGRKLLTIYRECGHTVLEGELSITLARIYQRQRKYAQAKILYERAIPVMQKTGNKKEEEIAIGCLGKVFYLLGEHVKAKEYYKKALAMSREIGDRANEGAWYGNLANVFRSRGEYVRAKEYCEKALAISREIGDRAQEGTLYRSLGDLFHNLGERVKAKECYEKALEFSLEIVDRKGQAECYLSLAALFRYFGEYRKSKLYCDNAFSISLESSDKETEARCYQTEGLLHQSLGGKDKAQGSLEKAIAIAVEIGDRLLETSSYLSLGHVFFSRGDHEVAEAYFEKALSINENIGHAEIECECCCGLSLTKLSRKNVQEAFFFLFRGIEKSEKIRGFLQDSDQLKISFADAHAFPYQLLSELFRCAGNPKNALYAAELGRARALADLMATLYSVENRLSPDPQTWTVVENVMKKESNSTCLYISYIGGTVFLWILKTSGVVQFRKHDVAKKTLYTRATKVAENLDEFFAIMAESFQYFGILPVEICEDRSLSDNSDIETNPESFQEDSPAILRQDKPGNANDPEPSLKLFYELLVHPVSDLLDEPEIIIVPDRNLYRVPFPALLNESGKYLSERFRIRVVPSLSTLKLIQDSPADYHCQSGALVVGDPDVGVVIYREEVNKKFVPLPGARKEAEMIARRLGVWPLLGQDATKKAVLEKMNSVSLIHIAAHGNAERGEIALAPARSTTGIPQEDDYLLKMSDISKAKVRAKLVVLSCCHSGRGQIRTEGVVGIARAFLGAGARSVLVALWALDDSATKKLMSRFYENLVSGESASASLHAAMKWMRDHGFTEVSRWAPFMLIGDDVTFAFEKY